MDIKSHKLWDLGKHDLVEMWYKKHFGRVMFDSYVPSVLYCPPGRYLGFRSDLKEFLTQFDISGFALQEDGYWCPEWRTPKYYIGNFKQTWHHDGSGTEWDRYLLLWSNCYGTEIRRCPHRGGIPKGEHVPKNSEETYFLTSGHVYLMSNRFWQHRPNPRIPHKTERHFVRASLILD